MRLSPQANGLDHLEPAELVASDIAEAIPQRPLDAAELVLGQAERSDDAVRRGAAMLGDGDSVLRADNAEQLGHPGFEVGPHRHVSYRDHAVPRSARQAARWSQH